MSDQLTVETSILRTATESTPRGGALSAMLETGTSGTLHPQTFTIATFRGKLDNRVVQQAVTWAGLTKMLTTHRERREKDGPLWSPTVYRAGAKRSNDNVEAITLAVADCDHGVSWEETAEHLSQYRYIAYSTHSFTPDDPRFRVAIELIRPVKTEDWPIIKPRIDYHIFAQTNDPGTCDLARIYYQPSHQPGAEHFAISHEGAPLDAYALPPVPGEQARSNGHKKAEPIADVIRKGQQHYTLLSLAGSMRRRGMNADEIDAALQVVNGRCEEPGPPENIRKIAQSVCRYPAGDMSAKTSSSLADGRVGKNGAPLPNIDAGIQDLATITSLAWGALRLANDPVYLFRHGGLPSRIEHDDRGAPVVRELTADRMRHELARVARWIKIKELDSIPIEQDAKPPADVVRDVLATPDIPLSPLRRIVEAPVFAPDGTLETEPGYHAKSKTFYAPSAGFVVPAVPGSPAPADMDRAKALIMDELLCDFSFVGDADRAHAAALFLLPFVRDLVDGPTPNHLVEAPTPGCGKGLLVDATLRPSAGRSIGLIAEAREDDEWRKRITACLREGRSVLMIDNLTRALDSGVVAAALTALTWDDRILGKSETISLPVQCVWVATANNPTMSTEIARRTIRIRLDPKIDRPWLRDGFRHSDLRAWVDENRGELVWAALTLARAWLAAGRPRASVRPLGSYEKWAAVVGGILEVAGIPGFLSNLDEFYEAADLEGALWRQFVAVWWEKFRENKVGAGELFPLAVAMENFDLGKGAERSQKTAFGMQLGKQRGRVYGEYRIAQAGTHNRAGQWRLLPVRSGMNLLNLYEPSEPIRSATFQGGASGINIHGGENIHEGEKVHIGSEGSLTLKPCASCGTEFFRPGSDSDLCNVCEQGASQ